MTIKNFKEIIDERGYQVDKKDREIFERNLTRSQFGSSVTSWNRGSSDVIEFVLYDSNDNQLPQGELGKMVRYIDYNTAVNTGIFRIEDVTDSKINGSIKFFIDTEQLIRDAGYSSGIFKTQVTLLNRRAASEVGEFDKLWIHEISPSRTEIRVLAVTDDKGNVKDDLNERYNIFINNGEFRDDTVAFVQQFVESINIQEVLENFLKIRGKVSSGKTYLNLIKQEFKVNDFDKFLDNIRLKFIQAMKAFVENRNYDVNSNNFGQALFTAPELKLSVDKIINTSMNVLGDIIDYYLPNRDIQEKHEMTREEQITYDELQKILKTTTDDSIYDSTIPPSIAAPIYGCTDPNAENYNPSAQKNDGSCIYRDVDTGTDVGTNTGNDDNNIPQTDSGGRNTTGYIDSDGNIIGSNRGDRTGEIITDYNQPRTIDLDYSDRRNTGGLTNEEQPERGTGEIITDYNQPRTIGLDYTGRRETDGEINVVNRDGVTTEYPDNTSTQRRTSNNVPVPVITNENDTIPTRTVDTNIDGGSRSTTITRRTSGSVLDENSRETVDETERSITDERGEVSTSRTSIRSTSSRR